MVRSFHLIALATVASLAACSSSDVAADPVEQIIVREPGVAAPPAEPAPASEAEG